MEFEQATQLQSCSTVSFCFQTFSNIFKLCLIIFPIFRMTAFRALNSCGVYSCCFRGCCLFVCLLPSTHHNRCSRLRPLGTPGQNIWREFSCNSKPCAWALHVGSHVYAFPLLGVGQVCNQAYMAERVAGRYYHMRA